MFVKVILILSMKRCNLKPASCSCSPLQESLLEHRCEGGAEESSQQRSFLSLAKWVITHHYFVHLLVFITVEKPSVSLFITSVDTIKESEVGDASVQEASTTPDCPLPASETGYEKKRPSTVCGCCLVVRYVPLCWILPVLPVSQTVPVYSGCYVGISITHWVYFAVFSCFPVPPLNKTRRVQLTQRKKVEAHPLSQTANPPSPTQMHSATLMKMCPRSPTRQDTVGVYTEQKPSPKRI